MWRLLADHYASILQPRRCVCLHPASFEASPLIGWAHTQNDPSCIIMHRLLFHKSATTVGMCSSRGFPVKVPCCSRTGLVPPQCWQHLPGFLACNFIIWPTLSGLIPKKQPQAPRHPKFNLHLYGVNVFPFFLNKPASNPVGIKGLRMGASALWRYRHAGFCLGRRPNTSDGRVQGVTKARPNYTRNHAQHAMLW